jgi:hypothetical protein
LTPARFELLVGACIRRHRLRNSEAHWTDIAAFFAVTPNTVRRWRQGETPIPRAVELVMEIFAAWPEVTASAVMERMKAQDLGITSPQNQT